MVCRVLPSPMSSASTAPEPELRHRLQPGDAAVLVVAQGGVDVPEVGLGRLACTPEPVDQVTQRAVGNHVDVPELRGLVLTGQGDRQAPRHR